MIHAILGRKQAVDYSYIGELEQQKLFWMHEPREGQTNCNAIFLSFMELKWCDLHNFKLEYFCWELDVSDKF